jgi:hypothetical protein
MLLQCFSILWNGIHLANVYFIISFVHSIRDHIISLFSSFSAKSTLSPAHYKFKESNFFSFLFIASTHSDKEGKKKERKKMEIWSGTG